MASTIRQRDTQSLATKTKQQQPIDVPNTLDDDDSASDDGNGSLPSFTPPDFTVKDLLSAIPKHCYERSAFKSFQYVLVDFAMVFALWAAAANIDQNFNLSNGKILDGYQGETAKWALWSIYWFAQGLVMTGIWVIAHECGHQAFSTSKQLNNAVGLVLHSLVLVPYHSWRVSHARHHAATGHAERDEVFVPKNKAYVKAKTNPKKVVKEGIVLDELLEDVPIYRLFWLVMQQLLGWPMYLTTNASGQTRYPKWTNHFDPESIIFDVRHRSQVIISDLALVAVAGLLHYVRLQIGWSGLVKYYFIPYLFVNHWLVMITFLQHTDPVIPHYHAAEWNFPRGALATMDRNLMGPIGPYILHGICETHVSHHICSKIPHYNAWEATEALKDLLGSHYLVSDENMFKSLWNSFRNCRYIEDDEPVCFYHDSYGRVARKVQMSEKLVDSGVDVADIED
ncbi:delta-12-fatty acid desaturase [Meredithblackwellia eburnea MCA 4105]